MAALIPGLGDAPAPLVDPAGFFSVIVSPQYFACKIAAKSLTCVGVLPTKAKLSVQISDVPSEATVALVALNQSEALESNTRFKQLSMQKTTIDQMPAIIQTFTYDELGNITLPVWIQYIDILQPKKLAVLSVSCASSTCSEYAPALNQIRQSFRMAPLSKTGQPEKRKLTKKSSGSQITFPELEKELEQ
jgi:hypothetical protein